MGDVFGADDALLASGFHGGSAKAGEGGGGDSGAEFGDDLGAVVVAGGFAGGEKDARIGVRGDEDKFRPFGRLRELVSGPGRLSSGALGIARPLRNR